MQVNKNYEDTVFWIEQIIDYYINDKPTDTLSPNELKVYNHLIAEHLHTLYYIQDRISKTKYMDEWLKPLKELAEKTILELDINFIKEIRGEDLASLRPLTSTRGFELARGHENKAESLAKEKSELQGHNRALNKLVLKLKERITQVEKERLELCRKIRELKLKNQHIAKLYDAIAVVNNKDFVPIQKILDEQVSYLINKDVQESDIKLELGGEFGGFNKPPTEPEKEIYIGTNEQNTEFLADAKLGYKEYKRK